MAPIRRYLRISKYSVLECRIYLDNPALTQTWLLNPRNPVLPRVIESVRPLVLPKLREEKERERSRKNKKRSIKDVVIEDEFEVSIFLTGTETRHSLLHKQKHFRDKVQTKLTSNSSRLTGASREAPIDLQDAADDVPILAEYQDDVDLDAIPAADETAPSPSPSPSPPNRRPKRSRRAVAEASQPGPGVHVETIDSGSDDSSSDELFVSASDNSDTGSGPPPKRRKQRAAAAGEKEQDPDDKKKTAMDISYEGFAIYGRVLCLVVKRRDGGSSSGPAPANINLSQTGQPGGRAMMENWITFTQLPEAGLGDEAL
ncbi:hypothetical protein B0T26DRAFT_746664 [Lasiosphaeria miniovina]|uniref:Uncharacterized protein n=1 Tax=Lasiosphaeria miniovina TaxID=1954250 RepID=A0AA40BIE8_9PEZI|nr:uncharacterized protein B0T26DRAFT_746664 [Lasiosphaeria miniovina]KAK0734802.1 hypothetical protein B0T26DRAFT_746664 [Lasiosphaeria miniovina]